MPPEVAAKAFEPFFTTKPVGKGSGLGLAQVYGFAKQSGGSVSIETAPGWGTRVKVYLPSAPAADREEDADAAGARQGASNETGWAARPATILLVDDDHAVREVTASALRDVGHAVLEASGGPAALDLLDRSGQRVDLLVVDFAMPGMNGVEVARAAQKARPGLPVLFITGYADLSALAGTSEDRIVQKPFRNGELERKAARCLRAARGGTGGGAVVREVREDAPAAT
jgi:CheY-like chemotaxis protein